MIERMLFTLLIVAACTVLYATYNLTVVTRDLIPQIAVVIETVVTRDLIPQIAVVIEAVAIIEDASVRISDSMDVLEAIEAERTCYANQGEWHEEFGCVLEVIE